MAKTVSIRIEEDLHDQLKKMKIHPRETYGDVIKRMVSKWKPTKSK